MQSEPRAAAVESSGEFQTTYRGTWARVTVDHFRHLTLQNVQGHRTSDTPARRRAPGGGPAAPPSGRAAAARARRGRAAGPPGPAPTPRHAGRAGGGRCHCPGRKPAVWAVKHPACPYKRAVRNRFTMGNAKGGLTAREGPDRFSRIQRAAATAPRSTYSSALSTADCGGEDGKRSAQKMRSWPMHSGGRSYKRLKPAQLLGRHGVLLTCATKYSEARSVACVWTRVFCHSSL
jgi:hypothetical protein